MGIQKGYLFRSCLYCTTCFKGCRSEQSWPDNTTDFALCFLPSLVNVLILRYRVQVIADILANTFVPPLYRRRTQSHFSFNHSSLPCKPDT